MSEQIDRPRCQIGYEYCTYERHETIFKSSPHWDSPVTRQVPNVLRPISTNFAMKYLSFYQVYSL